MMNFCSNNTNEHQRINLMIFLANAACILELSFEKLHQTVHTTSINVWKKQQA